MKIGLQVCNAKGEVLAQSMGEGGACLVYQDAYCEGDRIALYTDAPGHLIAQLEDSIAPTFAYMGGLRHEMAVPFGAMRAGHSPKSFSGGSHLIRARAATPKEIGERKNLALNPLDCHENRCLFPHALANVETRGEAVFAARNAIDGVTENHGHGSWPYQSWGIDRRSDAQIRIEFGRRVRVDEIILTTRADFPHDSWWTQATLVCEDGFETILALRKTDLPQAFALPPIETGWVLLKDLVKADDESPFPALTQIEAWGREG